MKIFCDYTGKPLTEYTDKIAAAVGDSITWGKNTGTIYTEYLVQMLGLERCDNYGVDGSTISSRYEPMCERAANISDDPELILVFGGTNDFHHAVPMGEWWTEDGGVRTANTDTSTFKGGLNVLCQTLISGWPDKKIVLLTPLHRGTFGTQKTDLEANSIGLYLEDYVQAIREAGEIYSLQVIDLYAESGLLPTNEANAAMYFHDADRLHPNAAGHERIARTICGKL